MHSIDLPVKREGKNVKLVRWNGFIIGKETLNILGSRVSNSKRSTLEYLYLLYLNLIVYINRNRI